MLHNFLIALQESFLMIAVSGITSIILGLLLSMFIIANFYDPDKNGFFSKVIRLLLNNSIELYTYIPFVALMILLLPFIKQIPQYNTSLILAIITLTIATTPLFIAFICNAVDKLPKDLHEISKFYSLSRYKAVRTIYLPECSKEIITAATNMFLLLVSYSTIAGLLGGGGLGKIIYEYGYQSFNAKYLIISVGSLIALSKMISFSGKFIYKNS